jgi:Tol biopolymer transport system component
MAAMGVARAHLLLAFVAAAAVVLAACGSEEPSGEASPPTTDGPDTSAPAEPAATSSSAEPGATASPTPHPFAEEPRDWIAYQTNRAGAEGIWFIHLDGTEDHQVALDVPGEHHHPDWYPDGTKLLLTSRTETDTIYVLDLETNAAQPPWECSDPCIGDDEAAWSPDGLQIVFVRAMEPMVDDVPTCALMIGYPNTEEVEQIGPSRSCNDRETFPHWSDDGSHVVYYRAAFEGDTAVASAVYVFDLSTGVETKLTDDALFGGDADWIGDEDGWIVFSTYPLRDFQCCEVSNLYRVRPDGSELVQLTFFETDAERATQPRVTPDGASILYTAVFSDRRVPALVPLFGGDPIQIVESGIYTHPVRQPGLCPDDVGCGTPP